MAVTWTAVYEKGKDRVKVHPVAVSFAKAKSVAKKLMQQNGYTVGSRKWRLITLYNDGVQVKANPEHEIRELELFIDNDADLYRQQKQPIEKNLLLKMAK